MDNGADPMIPNNDNKETAFHYCGKSGNSEVNCCFISLTTSKHCVFVFHVIFIYSGCKGNYKTFTCWADSAGGK